MAEKAAIFIHAPTSLGILIHNFILPMSEHFLKLILDKSDEKYKNKKSFNEDDKRILSDLTELTIFLPKIDEKNFRWLNLSASNIHRDPSSHFFIEYLDRLKDRADKVESGRYVGKIFLKLLDSFTPTYKSEHIISIVEYLYKLKQNETKDSADKICNIYGSRGVYFLRDIYKKNKRADN